MICKNCGIEITQDNKYPSDFRYCSSCGAERRTYLLYRKNTLISLRSMNLESKIIQTKYLIKQTINEFGLEHVYISYSGGKDSTVLSHIAKQLYPNILHIPKRFNISAGKKKRMKLILLLLFPKMLMEKSGLLNEL